MRTTTITGLVPLFRWCAMSVFFHYQHSRDIHCMINYHQLIPRYLISISASRKTSFQNRGSGDGLVFEIL